MSCISATKVQKDGEVMAVIFGGQGNYEGTVYTLNLDTMKLGTIGYSGSDLNSQFEVVDYAPCLYP